MFDISWTEIMVIGVVALLVVGPKELPALLRTIGRYAGMIKQQAAEFRAQFDEAMRESELEQLKKEVENAGRDMAATVHDAGRSVETEVYGARREFDQVGQAAAPAVDAREAIVALPPMESASTGNGAARESVNGTGATATSAPQTSGAEAKTGA
jgi:sec-independent protein translocase protein TatB